MAAGFTVKNSNIDLLYARLSEIIKAQLEEKELKPVLHADMEIELSDLRPSVLDDIAKLEPCGQENPPVYFISRNLWVKGFRVIGRDQTHLKLTISDGKITYDAVAFGKGEWAKNMPAKVDLLYAFEKNSFNGRTQLQLHVLDLKASEVS
jgi:single-stranded-DNA-specific exonuclease